ncbi:hypothetical protein FB451DRAFT_1467856 [Mycena latifolia]|nr:hypothetical protein FB451DRAFT_1467856 [Mycena latifolia]
MWVSGACSFFFGGGGGGGGVGSYAANESNLPNLARDSLSVQGWAAGNMHLYEAGLNFGRATCIIRLTAGYYSQPFFSSTSGIEETSIGPLNGAHRAICSKFNTARRGLGLFQSTPLHSTRRDEKGSQARPRTVSVLGGDLERVALAEARLDSRSRIWLTRALGLFGWRTDLNAREGAAETCAACRTPPPSVVSLAESLQEYKARTKRIDESKSNTTLSPRLQVQERQADRRAESAQPASLSRVPSTDQNRIDESIGQIESDPERAGTDAGSQASVAPRNGRPPKKRAGAQNRCANPGHECEPRAGCRANPVLIGICCAKPGGGRKYTDKQRTVARNIRRRRVG